MTTNELMATADENTLYHIGSNDGFFMVVYPREYREIVNDINKSIVQDMANMLKKDIKVLSSKYQEFVTFSDEKITMLYRLNERTESTEKNKVRAYDSAAANINKWLEFVPIEEREVLEINKRVNGGVAVILPGSEHGKYWDREEWERDYGNRN